MAYWFGEGMLTDMTDGDISYLTFYLNRYVGDQSVGNDIIRLFKQKITRTYYEYHSNPEKNVDEQVNAMLGMILYWAKQKIDQYVDIKINGEMHRWYGWQGYATDPGPPGTGTGIGVLDALLIIKTVLGARRYVFQYKGYQDYFPKE